MNKAPRVIAIGLAIVILFALIAYNAANPGKPNFVAWNENMTLGDKETAKHHYVMYTDLFCPYCDKFSLAVKAHKDEFQKEYLEDKGVYFEIRMTRMNYVSHKSENSKNAAEGSYCAAKQNKFWDFYYTMLDKLWADYFSKGIGVSKDAKEHIPKLEMSYFNDAAEKGELNMDEFTACMDSDEMEKTINNNTNKAGSITGGGVPYFQFGSAQPAAGFAGNWDTDADWQNAKTMLNAGLK